MTQIFLNLDLWELNSAYYLFVDGYHRNLGVKSPQSQGMSSGKEDPDIK